MSFVNQASIARRNEEAASVTLNNKTLTTFDAVQLPAKQLQQQILDPDLYFKATFYNIKPTKVYNSGIIPEYVQPETKRRGIWKVTDDKNHRLEKGYSHNFVNPKSFNANASLSESELQRNQEILTLYKWLTRNSNTDMSQPISLGLLHDRKFVNLASAFVQKKMLNVPELQALF